MLADALQSEGSHQMYSRLWFALCNVLQTENSPVFFSPVLQFSAFCILIPTL